MKDKKQKKNNFPFFRTMIIYKKITIELIENNSKKINFNI